MKRNATILVSCLTASAVAMTGCGKADQPATDNKDNQASQPMDDWKAPQGLSGELTYYSANPQGLTDDLVKEFESKTGVKVKTYADVTGKITARLEAEKDNPQADLVYLASWSSASKEAKSGAYNTLNLSQRDKLPASWVPKDNTFAGRDGSALALVSNTDVAKDVPKDWADLADKKYKDMVIMPDPRESGTSADLIGAMVTKWGEDKTWQLFDSLFANGMTVQGANGPALDAVTSGSKGVVLGGVDYSAYAAKDKGEPIDVSFPASGTTVTPRPIMELKSTKNKAAADAFIDFMFSKQGQQISAKNYMIPANKDVAPKSSKPLDQTTQLSDDWPTISDKSKTARDQFVARYLSK